jgi:hypothetical protein
VDLRVPLQTSSFTACFRIWLTNFFSDSLTAIRARDGSVEQTLNLQDQPYCIAFDGASIWTSGSSGDIVGRVPHP